jgi:N6-adenosine-specific RNA methylase IME4
MSLEEVLAFAPPRFDADAPMLVEAPAGRHSKKPAEVHARIERLAPGPYLEPFAHQARPEWTIRGNEVVA